MKDRNSFTMIFIIRLFLVIIFLASGFNAYSRTILTSEAKNDYLKRLEIQPELASKLAIPANLTGEEKEALTFLYAYLPTPDLLDYDTDFCVRNVRSALQADKEMPWSDMVPDREWRHFVLPVRVNNEDLDESRMIFYEELRQRLKGMSMEEAILEVNHWCHEKVSYQPSDPRTSSPLVTMKNALGRCGEESTFTVAALRSVGIPARQVYTPRWAHTDDNHAWVEAWADGKWHFLGACEPEAALDLAWFNAPAARGMMMTTKVIGHYDGPEDKLETTPISTVINVTENYAPVANSTVIVTDSEGNPIEDAKVRFGLYNYAEFYPLMETFTDVNGKASISTGLGDFIVMATDGKHFNLSAIHAGDTRTLPLDKDSSFTGSIDFNLTPPPPGGNTPNVGAESAAINDRRKASEDSIRNLYTSTFLTIPQALEICNRLGADMKIADLLVESRANHSIIEKLLSESTPQMLNQLTDLLGTIAEKDLHDITPEVVADHLNSADEDVTSPLYKDYVLNPRIEFELLRPFKKEIRRMFSPEVISGFKENPRLIERFIRDEVATDDIFNPEGYRQSALSTLKYKIADPLSKCLAFVAICRAIGIPARYDMISAKAQFADKSGNWQDVALTGMAKSEKSDNQKSILQIKDLSELNGRTPKYFSHFTVSMMVDGLPQLMEFEDFEPLESINNRHEPISQGQYFLLSGQRLADGSVLAHGEFFEARPNEATDVPLIVRQNPEALQVIGSLNAELLYSPVDFSTGKMEAGNPLSILSTAGRGYYALGFILPGHEPSSHILNDISEAAEELAAAGRKILLLFPDKESAEKFQPQEYGNLPDNVVFGIDDGKIAADLKDGLELQEPVTSNLPIVVVADSFNRIVFRQQGYAIRLGETIANILNSL